MSRFSDCFLLLFGQLSVGGVIGLAIPPFSLIDRGFYRSSAGLFLAFSLLFVAGRIGLLVRGDAGQGAAGELVAWIAFTIALADYEPEKQRLEGLGLTVRTATHEWVHWRSLYVTDPDGNNVELVCFDPSVI